MIGLLFNVLRTLKENAGESLRRFDHRFARTLRTITLTFDVITFITSALLLTCFIIYVGYDHSPQERKLLMIGVKCAQISFIINIIFNFIFNRGITFIGAKVLNRVLNFSIFLTIIPAIFTHSKISAYFPFLYNEYFIFSILIVYSLVTISYGVMKLVSRRTNPAIILSASFLCFIIVGAFMLMLPRCSYYGIDFVDSVFIATSAVCITGLSSVDISTCLTPFGLMVLAVLIQIGALGVMTFTSFFAIFFSGNSSIYNQLFLGDIIYSKSMSALVPTLLYVLALTIGIEIIGTVLIFVSIHGTLAMNIEQEVAFSAFHSLSAFCNAGFSTIPGGLSNPALLYGNQAIYWVMSLLIVLGAIGFPILANIRDVCLTYAKKLLGNITHKHYYQENVVHIYSLNTKIVFWTFTILFLVGALAFFILEYNHTLISMTLPEKITQAVFNSVTPRSAGFSSINPVSFLDSTLLIVMFLMWVGGASQSTAGGIKVNTLAALLINLRSIIFGRKNVTAFRRTISLGSIRRANAVVSLSIMSYAVFATTILILEPHLPTRELLFETLSALFTVGSSLGITDSLSDASKIVLCSAMFVGRVGLLSMLTGIAGRHHELGAKYPTDNIIIS